MKQSLTRQIVTAMIAGISIGLIMQYLNVWFPENAASSFYGEWLAGGLFSAGGQIFVNSLKLLVVPLVFVSLVCGTTSLGANRRMGMIALKTVGLYIATTCIAISLALFLSSQVSFGLVGELPGAESFSAREAPPLIDVFVGMFPTNPVQAMADGNMLQIIIFSILFGVAVSQAGDNGQRIGGFFNDLNEIIMKMVGILMALAPYGVFCLLAKLFFTLDITALQELALYFVVLAGILILHGTVVYGTLVSVFAKLNPIAFFKKMWPAQTMAFATASSNATMPVTMEVVEEKIGVRNSVASFTIPLGATINMDGTAIMQGVATVFIAQIYGIDIGLAGYLTVILTATLASIGTAGVPGVGLITLTMVLTQAGLPVEGVAIILGVDRLLDMIRTAVNITGDAAVSAVVAKSENELDMEIFNSAR
jgi:Na+/H+-dicarboxylate symporter